MAKGSPNGGESASLQSNDTRSLLDVVDNLRSQGISRYVDLPEIVVCGEQSSGKSSVLEAISGMLFPSKDNLCTRFATELILRRGPVAPIRIRIVPGSEENRTEAEIARLLNFNVSVSAEDLDLGDVIESAKKCMGINDDTKVFSSDILRLELSGPEQPHLTLVDLPGFQIPRSPIYEKSADIILAVVSAKNDFNNQSSTRYSRQIDPRGVRTLGLITKPDTLHEGCGSESFYIELAQNKEVKFKLGWHVLRNRDYTTRNSSLQERNRTEKLFFSSGAWGSLNSSQVGLHSLKSRLSKILRDQILVQLPDVLSQIQGGICDCTRKLEALGTPRATVQEQKRHLLTVSQSFTYLIIAAADGEYSDSFFGDASTHEGYQKRLRANLRNVLTKFADTMREQGHTYDIVDQVSTQGRELPGTFGPLIIGQRFLKQRKPWTRLVKETMEEVVHAVRHVLYAALSHVCNPSTREAILMCIIYPKLDRLEKELQEKVIELLKPHDTRHLITYNHYLTDNVQKAQAGRRMREIKKTLERFFGDDYTNLGTVKLSVNVDSSTKLLVTKTEADMNIYASSTATDFMQAYYKVALKKFVDDFSVLAVKARIFERLPALFCPENVLDIKDEMVATLAAEDEESSVERERCCEKLKVLENGLRELKSVQEHPSLHYKGK
ncbi:hypothetical protein PMIN06_009457 [Paraphaeosphaeria minitans]